MPFVDDDRLVEAFLMDRANPAFGAGISVRRANV